MVISFKHKTAVLNFIIFYLIKPIHEKRLVSAVKPENRLK